MNDICECGNIATAQGYCEKCLRAYEYDLSLQVRREQFDMFATLPRSIQDIETEKAISESIESLENNESINLGGKMEFVVTSVKINRFEKDKLKGYASITLNDDLVINGIRIVNGQHGLFIGFPENRKGEKNYGIVYPLKDTTRQAIQDAVITEYESVPA